MDYSVHTMRFFCVVTISVTIRIMFNLLSFLLFEFCLIILNAVRNFVTMLSYYYVLISY